MMTRKEFEAKAVRDAERKLGVPPGWWGTYTGVTNGCVRVMFSSHSRAWVVSRLDFDDDKLVRGVRGGAVWRVVSKHDSRSFAISKARKL